MANATKIEAQQRTAKGTRASNRLRLDGFQQRQLANGESAHERYRFFGDQL